jgi:hypothetical protein
MIRLETALNCGAFARVFAFPLGLTLTLADAAQGHTPGPLLASPDSRP